MVGTEPVRNNSEMAFYLVQFLPSTFTMGERKEIVVGKELPLAEFKAKLSAETGIQNLGLLKTYNYPVEILRVPDMNWDRKDNYYYMSDKPETLSSGPHYISDGETLIYRNNDELLKELTPEEKNRLENDAKKSKNGSYRMKEEALHITQKD